MKKISKAIIILPILMLLLVGCTKEVERVKMPTAEDAIELFNKYNVENNIEEMVKLYSDVYVEYVGYDTSQLIKAVKSSRKDISIKQSETKSIEDVSDGIKKATVSITSVIKDTEETADYVYAIVKENDGWAVSPDGITSCINFDVPMIEKDKLNLNLIKEAVLFDGAVIRVNVINETKNQYILGDEDEKSEIRVETTEGTYKNVLGESVTITKNMKSYFLAKLDDLKGDIVKVTLTSVYDADKDSNPILDTKRDITIYSK